jgi:catechol 2,3-dioxygenase-like lactoylglutathione lyase family enzyme
MVATIDTIGYVILFVRDVKASSEFFRDSLGIAVRNAHEEWAELETRGTTLALHRSEQVPPHHHPALPEVVFQVDDVRGAHAILKGRGVGIHDLKEVWASPEVVGVSAEFHDLDGNRLSVHGVVPKSQWPGDALKGR